MLDFIKMYDEIKVNFSKPMLILKIRETYKAPYHKNKFISVSKTNCSGLAEFKKFMHQYTGNWSSGSYDIQFVYKEGNYTQNTIYSTLVRIDIRDGKVVKLWKNSPYTKKEYAIWDIFKEFRAKRKEAKKKVIKKKPVKKRVVKKKKPVKKKILKKKIVKKKPVKKVSKKKVIKKKPVKKKAKKKK